MKITEHTKFQIALQLKFASINCTADGGVKCTKEWYKYRFSGTNDSAVIALVAKDFGWRN